MMRIAACLAVLLVSPCAFAQAPEASFEAGVSSDYRWRGVSQTSGDAIAEADLSAGWDNGIYIDVWAAAPLGDGEFEVDPAIGFAFPVGPGELDLGVAAYVYPDADNLDYATLASAYRLPLGDTSLTARLEYAPDQSNLSDTSTYAALEVEHRLTDAWWVLASAGWEEGAFTLDGEKLDYTLGARWRLGFADLDLLYVGNDEKKALAADPDAYADRLVVSLRAGF